MRPSRSAALAGALIVLLAALTLAVLEPSFVHGVDWHVHRWVAGHLHGARSRGVCRLAALCGQRGVVIGPLVIAALLAARRHRSVRPLLVTAAVLLGIGLGVYLLKIGVGRVAPGAGRDAVHADGLSYPSGHAVNGLVCWALALEFLASLGGRTARLLPVRRRRGVAVLLSLAAGIGMTGLDYHWLSDSIAGWLLGALVLDAVLAVGPVRSNRAPGGLNAAAAPESVRPSPSA